MVVPEGRGRGLCRELGEECAMDFQAVGLPDADWLQNWALKLVSWKAWWNV